MADKNTAFHLKDTLNVNGSLVDLSIPKVMGILNITPDSFYDGGQYNSIINALSKTEAMLSQGASFIDIGAYSSRPKAEDISVEQEKERLLPILKAISKEFPQAMLSVDTFRSEIAYLAINEGAHIINDISGGELDENMFTTIAKLNVPYILMHMKGTPQNMLQQASYTDVFDEVLNYFIKKADQLKCLGIKDIIIDPGFGFAKTKEHSFELLTKLDQFKLIGLPLLAGLSRKSMIYKLLGITSDEALNGTTSANTIALLKGANILRVHDVKEAVEAIKIVGALQYR